VFRTALDERLQALHAPTSVRQALQPEVQKLAEAQLPPQLEGVSRQALRRALDDSFVYSFRVITLIAALAALLSSLCAWLFIEPPPRPD
jgi:hypothetical protein